MTHHRSAETGVRIATGLRAATQSIAWIGTKIGCFENHGLKITFPRLEVGGPECVAGLLRGDWDFAQTGAVPIAEAVLRGGDAVILLRTSPLQNYIVIMTNPRITGLDQLNGKSVGVLFDAYSGQTGVIVRKAVERAGAAARYVGLGTYHNIFSAVIAGDIDAGALPFDFRFLEQGQNRWNFFETSLRLPEIFATTRRKIAADRAQVLSVLCGLVETFQQFKTKAETVVPILQEFLGNSDRRAVERIYQFYASVLPLVPRPELREGMLELRDLFSQRYPNATGLEEADIADLSLIDEIEQSGSIAQMRSA
jgi:ABC-type nitrate/sulfonate/bicarbonate transport system substrate-binding protein